MAIRHLVISWVFTLVVVYPAFSWAEFIARVVAVQEGDRMSIHHKGRIEVIALKGIDCPELSQPYGNKAKQVTQAYVGTREVVVRGIQRNRQGQIVADIFLPDGRNIAHELIKEGLAWSQRGGNERQTYRDEEDLAMAAGKGLWADRNAIPPWKWQGPKKGRRKFSN